MFLEDAGKFPNYYYTFVHVLHVVVDIIRSATTANQKLTKYMMAYKPTFYFTSSFWIPRKTATRFITQTCYQKKKKIKYNTGVILEADIDFLMANSNSR